MVDSKQASEINESLADWLSGAKKVVIAGVGNPFRKDDNVGVAIVKNLQNKTSESVYLIEAETIPESYMLQIAKFNPTHVLLVDAGLINKSPGMASMVDPTQLIRKTSISTHTLPLRIFCEYLTKTTKAKIALLIIQPQDTSFGEGLTTALEQTAKNLANILETMLP